jgi:hypothetical protein
LNHPEGQAKLSLNDLVKQFTGQELHASLKNFAVFEEDRLYLKGTTIPALINHYFLHPSGLLLPKNIQFQLAPIDYAYRYIPLAEITNLPIPLETIVSTIEQYDRDDFVSACSKFADMSHPSEGTSELEDLIKTEMPYLHARVKGLLDTNHKYFGPQASLVLMKLTILKGSPDKGLPKVNLSTFILLCLAIQDFFSPSHPENSNASLAMELPANYSIHRKLNPAYEYHQYELRWESEEPVSRRLKAVFEETCGYPSRSLADFVAGLAMQTRDLRMNFALEASHDEDSINMKNALEKISCDIDSMSKKISDPTTPNFIWDFSAFHEFPVIKRSDGRYVVVENSLLVNRGLGWPLIYDSRPNKRLVHEVSMLAEQQAKEMVIRALGDAWSDRIVDGSEIISVFGGNGIQSADLAIEFENAWVVLEISAFRSPYRALAAESQRLYRELINQVADEAFQAVSTSEQFVQQSLEPKLTFRNISAASRMYPIVVATEKFTTNPLTLCDIRQEIENRRGGRHPRIAPVEVINLEELETLLLLSSTYGLSIVSLLEEKSQGNFWSDSINNFLATYYRTELHGLSRH